MKFSVRRLQHQVDGCTPHCWSQIKVGCFSMIKKIILHLNAAGYIREECCQLWPSRVGAPSVHNFVDWSKIGLFPICYLARCELLYWGFPSNTSNVARHCAAFTNAGLSNLQIQQQAAANFKAPMRTMSYNNGKRQWKTTTTTHLFLLKVTSLFSRLKIFLVWSNGDPELRPPVLKSVTHPIPKTTPRLIHAIVLVNHSGHALVDKWMSWIESRPPSRHIFELMPSLSMSIFSFQFHNNEDISRILDRRSKAPNMIISTSSEKSLVE